MYRMSVLEVRKDRPPSQTRMRVKGEMWNRSKGGGSIVRKAGREWRRSTEEIRRWVGERRILMSRRWGKEEKAEKLLRILSAVVVREEWGFKQEKEEQKEHWGDKEMGRREKSSKEEENNARKRGRGKRNCKVKPY